MCSSISDECHPQGASPAHTRGGVTNLPQNQLSMFTANIKQRKHWTPELSFTWCYLSSNHYFVKTDAHAYFTGIADLSSVLYELNPMTSKWKAIGHALNLYRKVEEIEKENKRLDECLSKILTLWLNRMYDTDRYGEPSWDCLARIVARCNNLELANGIIRRHGGMYKHVHVSWLRQNNTWKIQLPAAKFPCLLVYKTYLSNYVIVDVFCSLPTAID